MEVKIHEAKTTLSKLLVRVQSGEEIVITNGGKPIARLAPIRTKPKPRKLGSAKGQFAVPDDFNAPLPDDVLKSFGL
jgi:prevent-host-death family protein